MKLLEVHNGLSALMVEKSKYDGMWVSSLTHATSKGLPDNELVPLKERVDLVEEIRRITTKPIVVDIDTGGSIEHLPFLIRWFEKAGAYAVIMEDKKYPKQNSLLSNGQHQLEEIDVFKDKIKVAKQNVKNMKVIARLESLIAKHSMDDALIRALAYRDAGADGIMIHSKEQVSCHEVIKFALLFREHSDLPLVAVPTTYTLPEHHPFDITIEANHLLRASMKAMEKYIAGEEVELSTVEDMFKLCGH